MQAILLLRYVTVALILNRDSKFLGKQGGKLLCATDWNYCKSHTECKLFLHVTKQHFYFALSDLSNPHNPPCSHLETTFQIAKPLRRQCSLWLPWSIQKPTIFSCQRHRVAFVLISTLFFQQSYPEEEMLLVFDRTFTYGQSFYLVLTPEGKKRILSVR